ncbi:DUF4339 domain-containing protein [bacterium]|nr:DUF4339 domain-containing protein [bacterium]
MKYYINVDGQTTGPYSFIEMTQMPIQEDTLVCTDGEEGGWKLAREYTEFLHLFHIPEPVVIKPDSPQIPVKPDEVSPQPQSQSQTSKNIPVSSDSSREPLPSDRGYKTTIFFTILTCGIYGLLFPFLMGWETNITCESDGEKTPGFWHAFFFSLFTCGIYGLFYNYNWCDREAKFLEKHKSLPIISAKGCLVSAIFSILMIVDAFGVAAYGYEEWGMVFFFVGIILFLTIVGRFNIQHNLVNKTYNVENLLQEAD